MRNQTTRELLVTSALFTAVFSAINLWLTGFDIASTLIMAPLFLVVMFVSMRTSNRIVRAVSRRFGRPPPEPAAPPEATTERPQHAQRRRSRRRRRGRGRRT
jgi:hypothetical protein